MPGSNRRDIIRDGEIATYHIWSQTALQRFLLGRDWGLKTNNEHRRDWCMSLLEYMAKIFAVDLGNCHFVENHFHLIVRTRPDLVKRLTDEEVAYRWRMAWPTFNSKLTQWSRSPADAEIRKLLDNPKKLAAARHHLSSVSWYVGRFKELIAREANDEANTKGHFWAERFGSRELVDDAAILTCSMYIDVNQVKAGMAPSLLESMHTAIHARIIEGRLQEAQAAIDMFREKEGDGLSLSSEKIQELYLRCAWLAPVQIDGALKLVNDSWQAYTSPDKPVEPIPVLNRTTTEGDGSVMENISPSDHSVMEANIPKASSSTSEGPDSLSRVSNDAPQSPHPTTSISTQAERTVDDEIPGQSLPRSDDGELPEGPNGSSPSENPAASRQVDSETRQTSRSVAAQRRARVRNAKRNKYATLGRPKPTYEIHHRLFPSLPVRASDSPFLAMSLEQYLLLAQAAADRALEIRKALITKQEVSTLVPDELAAILRARGIDATVWYATLDAFAERFHYVLGAPDHVEAFAARAGRQWVHGVSACRELFREAIDFSGTRGAEEANRHDGGKTVTVGSCSPMTDPVSPGVNAGGTTSGIPAVPH